MIFRTPDSDTPFATSYLKDRHHHGHYDQWFVQVNPESPLPNYVPNAVTAMMAFATASLKNTTAAPGEMLELLEEVPLPTREKAGVGRETKLAYVSEQHV